MDRPSPTAQVLGSARRKHRPPATQLAWLSRGLAQAGGKLPLFDRYGQRHDIRTIRSCIEQGWAEPWFKNPIKPDWLVCRLTDRSDKHTSELQSLMRTSYAVFCLKK